jgi:hypothetical protein
VVVGVGADVVDVVCSRLIVGLAAVELVGLVVLVGLTTVVDGAVLGAPAVVDVVVEGPDVVTGRER